MLTFLLFLNDTMNVILDKMEKKRNELPSKILIQFNNRYFYSRTKMERVILRLRKRGLSMSYMCTVCECDIFLITIHKLQ